MPLRPNAPDFIPFSKKSASDNNTSATSSNLARAKTPSWTSKSQGRRAKQNGKNYNCSDKNLVRGLEIQNRRRQTTAPGARSKFSTNSRKGQQRIRKKFETQYQRQDIQLDAASFPTLDGNLEYFPVCLPEQASLLSSKTGDWNAIAAVKVPSPKQSETKEQGESSLLLTDIMISSSLTLLGRKELPTIPASRSSIELLGKKELPNMPSSQSSIANIECDGQDKKANSPNDDEPNTGILRAKAPLQLNLPKLRDRWWSLLQESAEKKREQLDMENQRREEQLVATGSICEDQRSDVKEEFVELRPFNALDDSGFGRVYDDECQNLTYSGRLSKHLESSHPYHSALIQSDGESLYEMLKLPAKSVKTLAVNQKQILSENVIRWSPLQLAVKLDMPDALQKLLRALSLHEDEARRRPGQTADDVLVTQILTAPKNAPSYLSFPTPLMEAVRLGHEECVQILLSRAGLASPEQLIAIKDDYSNNALHFCGRADDTNNHTSTSQGATPSLLKTLLATVNSAGGSTPSKVLTARNQRGQTPLHVVCEGGRADLMDVYLKTYGNSSLFTVLLKVLTITDHVNQTPLLAAIASGSTDLVMALLMWKGNHYSHRMGARQGQRAKKVPVYSTNVSDRSKESIYIFPLTWAIKTSAGVDMVRLLLEFYAPINASRWSDGERMYELTDALQQAVGQKTSKEKLEIISELVVNGANPCEERARQPVRSDSKRVSASKNEQLEANASALSVSALSQAARLGDGATVTTLLESFHCHERSSREARRRDPILCKHPESFFRGLETTEKAKLQAALSDALSISLYFAYKSRNRAVAFSNGEEANWTEPDHIATTEDYLSCGLALFRAGARLGVAGLARLKCSLGTSVLKRIDDVIASTFTCHSCGPEFHYNFRSGYTRDVVSVASDDMIVEERREFRVTMDQRTDLLRQSVWFQDLLRKFKSTHCSCIKMTTRKDFVVKSDDVSFDLVTLVTGQGADRFFVHGSIVSQQSARLEAAIRFARMSSRDDDNDQLYEIDLRENPTRLCLLLLQHLYHGSICCGLPTNPADCCQDLLDLLLLAEEFLCPSLAQECEMRLLSINPWACFCSSCNRATTEAFSGKKLPGYTDNFYSECVYSVNGPSTLINTETVLDIIAIAQYLESNRQTLAPDTQSYDMDVSIHLNNGALSLPLRTIQSGTSNGTSSDWTRMESSSTILMGVREVAMAFTIENFCGILQSEAFASQVEDSLEKQTQGCRDEAPLMLLQMCLDEIANSKFKEEWHARSVRLK